MSHSNTLAQQQSELLFSIFTTKNIAAQATNTPAIGIKRTQNRGLQTYQANAHTSALRSLQTAYPVIAQLIGEEAFEYLARDFWAQRPPTRGDLAQWGGELPSFITTISALQTEPYLSDAAKAEWALHTTATEADQAPNLASFSLLTEHDPDKLTLQLAPGTTLIHSNYPIASVLTAHLYNRPSCEAVGRLLRDNVAEASLVWRQGLRPMVTSCAADEAVFLSQLLAGKSLLAALDASALDASFSADVASFDFNSWLPHAVQSGLLLGACSL